jgi:hypothetical protein
MKNYEQILEQLNVEQFTLWKPQIGESLVGEIIAWTNFTHHAYGLQDAMLLDTPSGRVSVALNQYLKTGLRNGKARIGSLVAIRFVGIGVSKFGTNYNELKLFITNEE